ncbi:MAG TPA: copper resistance protein CopC [Thermaerobacter sp.]
MATIRYASLLRVLALFLAFMLVVAWARPVAAHASLERSFPADGAVLEEPPDRVELVFSEPVEAAVSKVTLERAGGEPVELGELQSEGTTLRADVAGELEPGEYVLNYRVLSADGHPVEGKVSFQVAATGPGTPEDEQKATQPESTTPPETPGEGDEARAAEKGGDAARGTPWPWIVGGAAVLAAALLTLGRRR